jgi:hypothetical protein
MSNEFPCNLGYSQLVHDSGKALLIAVDQLDEEVWVPKSVIHADSQVFDQDNSEGDLVVQSWWAEKNGWA